jgi:hypothetical protein
MRKNLLLFGEYPDDLKAKDRPRRTWSMNKLLKPSVSSCTRLKCSAQRLNLKSRPSSTRR